MYQLQSFHSCWEKSHSVYLIVKEFHRKYLRAHAQRDQPWFSYILSSEHSASQTQPQKASQDGCSMGLGCPHGMSWQGLAARTCPTAQPGAGQPGRTRGRPSPGHQAPHWGWGWAEARPDTGVQVCLAWQGPWPAKAGLWEAGDQPCYSITGTGDVRHGHT